MADLLSPYRKWQGAAAQLKPTGSTSEKAETTHQHQGSLLNGLAVKAFMWVTVLMPFAGLAAALVWFALKPSGWMNVGIFLVMYAIGGFGITIGYHRLLAHRAFVTHPILRFFIIGAGSMAMQGPAIKWVATHRRHHQKSDHEGDPHSPHLHGDGVWGLFRGLWHAHTGWLLEPDVVCSESAIRDLATDPVARAVDRTYFLWVFAGAAIPFLAGLLLHHTWSGSLAAMVWGFVVRIGLMHHVTWSVNSICHTFGYRTYKTTDDSRNNALVAMLSLGEGWHNNHHAFPTSARHGLRWYEPDVSYYIIRTLNIVGLAKQVRVPTREQQDARRGETP